jgi:hypothetical protein
MSKEVESTSGSIEFTKSENDALLLICHCNVIFKGSNLWVDTDGVSIQDNDNIGLIHDNGNIPIADNEGLRIALSGCAIKMDEGQNIIDYRGPLITFSKCTSENNSFTFDLFRRQDIPTQWFQFQNLSRSEISLEKSRIIYAKNADIRTSLDAGKEFAIRCEKAKFVLPTDSKIELIDGKIDLLEVKHAPFAINLPPSTTVGKLIGSNVEISDIKAGPGTGVIDINGHNVSFKRLHSVSQMKFSNDAFHLASDSCDFSETKITVADSASFDIAGFNSIATIWDPMLITYRGFNPRKSKNTSTEANIPAAREFFCEMKTRFSNKGDSIAAGEFHCVEMIAYKAYLQNQSIFSSDRKILLLQDRFSMFISSWSSNFGQNWVSALFWYISIGFLISHILLFNGTKLCSFDTGKFYANVYSPLTIDFDHVRIGLLISSWYAFLWMAWKITAGFLIYQIIVSTRRFIRKW